MEVKIGMQNVGREMVLESTQTADEVGELASKAIADGTELRLTDEKGRLIIIPANVLAYVEIGAVETRPVGFGAL